MNAVMSEQPRVSPGRDLERFLNPTSIAVVGVSSNPSAVGSICLQALKRSFTGTLYAVNPTAQESLFDVPAFTRVTEIPHSLDLVIIAVPMQHAEAVAHDCVEAGAKSVMLFTAGFAESGEDGAAAQARIRELAEKNNLILSGPNTMGYVNTIDDVLATFYITPHDPTPEPGKVALISQSGGFGVHLARAARESGIALGTFVTTGNEADLHVSEVLIHLVDRDQSSLFLVFCESIKDATMLRQAAWQAWRREKPIVLLKVGSSEAGGRASLSHTASMSGSDSVLDAACRQFGILRVTSMDEMVDCAKLLESSRPMTGGRVGIVTGSGGGGILAADACQNAGLSVPEFSAEFVAELAAGLPTFASAVNPVDITAQAISAGGGAYRSTLQALAESDECDAILVLSGMVGPAALEVARSIRDVYVSTTKPMVVAWMSARAEATDLLRTCEVPLFDTPERAAAALGNAGALLTLAAAADTDGSVSGVDMDDDARQAVDDFLASMSPGMAADGALDEAASKKLLEKAGFAVPRDHAGDDRSVREAFAALKKPVVLKVQSADIPHKSDVGGVALNIHSEDDLVASLATMSERVGREAPGATIDGYLLQEQIHPGVEVLVGFHHDQTFGPVVTVGLGGKLVEILAESTSLVVPFNHDQARQALSQVCQGRLVNGKRSLTRAHVDVIADHMVRLGAMGAAVPVIKEIEINPLIANDSGVHIVDCLARVDVS